MSHTREPWATEYRKTPTGGFSQEIFDAAGQTIATIAWHSVYKGNGVTGTDREENAHRIVACVNACAGIPTEQLDAYPGSVMRVMLERDELTVAANEAIESGEAGDWQTARRVLESAVSNVKGGAS